LPEKLQVGAYRAALADMTVLPAQRPLADMIDTIPWSDFRSD
jgi:hypothetical protein